MIFDPEAHRVLATWIKNLKFQTMNTAHEVDCFAATVGGTNQLRLLTELASNLELMESQLDYYFPEPVMEMESDERQDLRQRIGREWTREHYQNHRHEKEQQLIREKIQIVDELMTRRGHNHLVIAGSPTMVGRMTSALPPRLKSKLISTLNTNPKSGLNPIMLEAVNAFVEAEHRESHDRVRLLRRQLMSSGLAVAGYDDSLAALEGAYADMLLIDSEVFSPGEREKMMRLAASQGVGVETVSASELLRSLGGVGCLLRYRLQNSPARSQREPALH